MRVLLYIFLGLAGALWLSSFGYILILQITAWCRSQKAVRLAGSPGVAVVIPTLNEEPWIERKLDNLRELKYPADRLRVVVVDGGSEDGTVRLVRERIQRGEAIRLIEMGGRVGKAAQLNRAFAELEEDFVVVTDADSALEPSCLSYLIGHLEAEPCTGVVGAVVCPRTDLIEERVHWSLLNWMWWLEGEAWSAPGLSGVCYAVRRSAFKGLDERAATEDIHLALRAADLGYRVRICPQARAIELRVPRSLADYLRFRQRRGSAYLAVLSCLPDGAAGTHGWKVAQRFRHWQMTWLPRLVVLVGLLAGALALSPHWPWTLVVAALLGVSALPLLLGARAVSGRGEEAGLIRWGWAGVRCAFLTLVSLLFLKVPVARAGPADGGGQ